MTEHDVDGFYVGYFSGATGNSMGMFVFRDGVVTGADIGGGRYDGKYSIKPGPEERVAVTLTFFLPTGHFTITGITADAQPLNVEMSFDLPVQFDKDAIHRIETPLGAINAKLDKVRGI
ncbi:hypothetical protein D8666_13225 [Ochrobactrum soli]|uniref:hypothetical protein n=1 Tax=Ochrobactrum soli TaxID=2448455 RepID=UPI000EF1BB04|nr:hypothetical protein [[Ochrobactrum] soli]RLL74172.1 hypothetical protein D8666_13225 [[Ochrobactrum] soli]